MKLIVISTARIIGLLLLGLLIAASGIWGVLAISYSGPASDILRTALAFIFAIASLGTLIALASHIWRWRALAGYLIVFTFLVSGWRSIKPSNERDWQTDVAVLPLVQRGGSKDALLNRFTQLGTSHKPCVCHKSIGSPGVLPPRADLCHNAVPYVRNLISVAASSNSSSSLGCPSMATQALITTRIMEKTTAG